MCVVSKPFKCEVNGFRSREDPYLSLLFRHIFRCRIIILTKWSLMQGFVFFSSSSELEELDGKKKLSTAKVQSTT